MGWPDNIYGIHEDAPPAIAPAGRAFGWPSKEQLSYAKELMTVVLLALAFPWLIVKLLTNPATVLAGAGRKHIAKGD